MNRKNSKRGDMQINQLSRELNRFLTAKSLKGHLLKRTGSHRKETLLTHLHMKPHKNLESFLHLKNVSPDVGCSSSFNVHSSISRNGRPYVTQSSKFTHDNTSPKQPTKHSSKQNSKANNSRKSLYKTRSSKEVSIDSLKGLTQEFWHTVKFRTQANESLMQTPIKPSRTLQASYHQLTGLKESKPKSKQYKAMRILNKDWPKSVGLMLKSAKEEIKKKFEMLVRERNELGEVSKSMVQEERKRCEVLQRENYELKSENVSLLKQVEEFKDINKELIKRNTKLVKRNIDLNSEIKRNKDEN
eukprot:TRINITY_DN11909_c0_g2_i2.p1 TRINITY_DN11909_c0_g2~~TRINITY_DN11909_c0_g2_i2.p1  ORF type:complete len:301 (+),score=47.49 TRINITY_DN11909_c0_g2_i2:151-1053(+)